MDRIFLVILFSFLKKTLYEAWKSHCRQLQVLIMIFNKKALVFLASPTQRTHYEIFWILHREFLLMNVSKTVCGIVLVLLWFWIIDTRWFFYKQHFYKKCQTEIGKNWAKARQDPEAEPLLFENYLLSPSTLSFWNIGDILKNVQETNVSVLITLYD